MWWRTADESNNNIPIWQLVAELQRMEPEERMLAVQRINGGGVLNPVVENAGDLIHRMSEDVTRGTGGYEAVSEKVKKLISSLTHPYGFENEFEENIQNNANYKQLPVNDFKKRLYNAMALYADAHKVMPTYNQVTALAKNIAIAIGERRWPDALSDLYTLQDHLDKGVDHWVKQTQQNNLPEDTVSALRQMLERQKL